MADQVRCQDCGELLHEGPEPIPAEISGEGGAIRTPCPNCGSTARDYTASVSDSVEVTDAVKLSVRRGVNSERLAVAAFIIATSIAVGAATGCALIGIAVFVGLVLIFAVPFTRHLLMEGLHRLSGR